MCPIEVPSSEEAEERLRWFEFYGDPGTERIFIVLTRDPLSGVPTAEELVAFCGLNKDKCPWQVPAMTCGSKSKKRRRRRSRSLRHRISARRKPNVKKLR